MKPTQTKETDLYQPVKQLLEGQGYEVKGEIGAADVVACRGDEEPVIVELKTGFSLSLFHQGVERQGLADLVYIAVPRGTGAQFKKSLKNNKALCKRLGLGLITVRMKDRFVEIHVDPAEYKPRKLKQKKIKLLREFAKRVGDPNKGGATRQGLMTAYRQDALKCICVLNKNGPTKAAFVAEATDVETARRIMADNHYGWFQRGEVGIYELSPEGKKAMTLYKKELRKLAKLTKAIPEPTQK